MKKKEFFSQLTKMYICVLVHSDCTDYLVWVSFTENTASMRRGTEVIHAEVLQNYKGMSQNFISRPKKELNFK